MKWFDCVDEKKQNLGFLQILKLLTVADSENNPAINVVGSFTPTSNSNGVSGVTPNITTSTITDVLLSPGVGIRNYITDILVTNSHATIGTWVRIIEETSAVILWRGYATENGGGFSSSINTALKSPNTNRKIQIICETAGANVVVSVSGFKGA